MGFVPKFLESVSLVLMQFVVFLRVISARARTWAGEGARCWHSEFCQLDGQKRHAMTYSVYPKQVRHLPRLGNLILNSTPICL